MLAAANLVPLAGVLLWGWDAFALMALFWMENVVIGALTVLRLLAAAPSERSLWLGKLFVVPFFCFHYGMFASMHGLFLFEMLGKRSYDPLAAAGDYGLWPPLAALAASHLFSFLWNFLGRGEFRQAALKAVMMQPYSRVIVLHLAIIFGGMAALALGSPLWALLVLIALKIGLDLKAHVKEHATEHSPRA